VIQLAAVEEGCIEQFSVDEGWIHVATNAKSTVKTDTVAYQHHIVAVSAQQLKPADAHRRTGRKGIGRKEESNETLT